VEILALPMTRLQMNCYVIRDGNSALIIDPGAATPELLDAIDGYTVKTVVNTHCHCDHCGGNAEILKRTGAELVLNEAEIPLLRLLPQQSMVFGVPVMPSPDPDRFLNEGDTIEVGTIRLSVRLAPGHSPGHLLLVGNGFVFCGDVLCAGSIGRTDGLGCNYEQLLESIRTKLLTLPDETVVYSGHGETTTIGIERRTNPFLLGL
jgi:hydroxyacylglutathione hydrolase